MTELLAFIELHALTQAAHSYMLLLLNKLLQPTHIVSAQTITCTGITKSNAHHFDLQIDTPVIKGVYNLH